MFLSRVILGHTLKRTEQTDPDNPVRRPPERMLGIPYDSILGEKRALAQDAHLDFREYIVYDRRQCYPEYVIFYRRKEIL
jgi:hypothetical protein